MIAHLLDTDGNLLGTWNGSFPLVPCASVKFNGERYRVDEVLWDSPETAYVTLIKCVTFTEPTKGK